MPNYSQPQAPAQAPQYGAPFDPQHYSAQQQPAPYQQPVVQQPVAPIQPGPVHSPAQVAPQEPTPGAQQPLQPAAVHSPPGAPGPYGPPPGAPAAEAFAATAPPDEASAPAALAQPGMAEAAPGPPIGGGPRVIAGFLVSYETDLGQAWTLYQGSNVVGRQGASEGLDVQVDHPTTSSRHAIIFASARPGRLQIEDTGSTNGTFIGERRLDPRVRNELRDGDQIRFGGYSAIVKIV